ncbi:membrane protein [Pontibacillus halophilus JSM 076056 = DSM 19796]|uniref:Membrane protein n=1 Tax=Pontibacillus halophilus JSM 076056 = DSM 19796 TaxID=1385510 RepID=A0A0A5I932_9BACI|nr:AEC family transporter [Pontibacillus halophilus]KGX92347.1 membrane protein [Pontibacillus halophilus JSM 076056 = DSM 19796]
MSFVTVLLPIFFVFGLGFIAQKLLHFDPSPFSKLALYILVPVLVFQTFYEETITFSYVFILIYMLGLCASIILIVTVLSKFGRYTEEERCGLVLSSAFTNNGNYGTPLILFLFGSVGMETAIVLMVLQQLLMSTLGVYYAAKGGKDGDGISAALRAVRKMPMVYGALVGIAFHYLHLPLGELKGGIELVASAAIPIIMLTLGMQLATLKVDTVDRMKVSIALVLKLVAAPLLAALIVMPMPVDLLTKQIMIIMAATPTAANTTMYAIQFQTAPQTVTTSTFATTVLSIITMPIVIYFVS